MRFLSPPFPPPFPLAPPPPPLLNCPHQSSFYDSFSSPFFLAPSPPLPLSTFLERGARLGRGEGGRRISGASHEGCFLAGDSKMLPNKFISYRRKHVSRLTCLMREFRVLRTHSHKHAPHTSNIFDIPFLLLPSPVVLFVCPPPVSHFLFPFSFARTQSPPPLSFLLMPQEKNARVIGSAKKNSPRHLMSKAKKGTGDQF